MELFECSGFSFNGNYYHKSHHRQWENGINERQYYHHHLQIIGELFPLDLSKGEVKLYHRQHISMGGDVFEVNKDGSLGKKYLGDFEDYQKGLDNLLKSEGLKEIVVVTQHFNEVVENE